MARIIVTLIFGGFGVFMFFYGLRQLLLQRRLLRNAAPVSAVITHSAVFSSRSADTDQRPLRDNSTTTHRPDVRFRYEIGGRTYESDLMYPNSIVVTYASRESAAEALAPYPPGATVRALAADDRVALASLTQLPFLYEGQGLDASGFRQAIPELFTPAVRRCLAQARPIAEDDRYVLFCPPYGFYFGRTVDGYRLIEFMADGEE